MCNCNRRKGYFLGISDYSYVTDELEDTKLAIYILTIDFKQFKMQTGKVLVFKGAVWCLQISNLPPT